MKYIVICLLAVGFSVSALAETDYLALPKIAVVEKDVSDLTDVVATKTTLAAALAAVSGQTFTGATDVATTKTPAFIGQALIWTTSNKVFTAKGLTTNDWVGVN